MKNKLIISAVSMSFLLTGCGSGLPDVATVSNKTTTPTTTPVVLPVFTNGMAATRVLGQADFTSNSNAVTQSRMYRPQSVSVDSTGVVRVSDTDNKRVLGFNAVPTSNGVNADFVLGQSNFTSRVASTAANGAGAPMSAHGNSTYMVIADLDNHRVQIFNPLPTTGNPSAILTIGATSPSSAGNAGCTATEMQSPVKAIIAGSKVIVADLDRARVVIYNSIPTADGASADVVVGQPNMTTCTTGVTASKLTGPNDVWSDGTKLIIADWLANRVLIYNTLPTTNGAAADVVLGQADFTSSTYPSAATASTMRPRGVHVNSEGQLFVADEHASRILIWNSIPTVNNKAADIVIGQTNFTTSTATSTTSATLSGRPTKMAYYNKSLFVADTDNNRVLVFEGL